MAGRIPYSHIDSTRKVTYNYTHAERQGRDIGNNLGRRYELPNANHYINRRHIPLKRLPYNGLLFKYMILRSDPAIQDDGQRRNNLIAQLLNATYFDSIIYDRILNRFRICISTFKPKMKYYYTSPIASVGVAGWGDHYNVEICCRIRRDVDVAYLKGGTHGPGDAETNLQTITQRGSKFTDHPDFDYLRINNCDRIGNSCGQVGNNNDVCLVMHRDIIENEISGIYCMAGQDSLIRFNNNENSNNLYSPLNGPGRSVSTAFDQIYNNVILRLRAQINPADPQTRANYDNHYLYMNSIFLTLEADYRADNDVNEGDGDTGYLGFSEITLYAFGHYSLTDDQFMPTDEDKILINPLPAPHQAYNGIIGANEITYNVPPDDLDFIFNTFYLPMTVVEIVGITAFDGRIAGIINIPAAIVAHNPANQNDVRNRNTGIFVHGLENFRLHDPVYSLFHNMFISTYVFNGIDPLLRRVNITKPPLAPNPGTAANLSAYTFNLHEDRLVSLFLSKAIIFEVNHRWRNRRNGRLIYLETGPFNNNQNPSISRSVIDRYNEYMNDNDILSNPMDGVDQLFYGIPGFRQVLTGKNGAIHSPLFKLKHFLDNFGGFFLIFRGILRRTNINSIIDYIDNIPAGRITLIRNGDALAGGYRKKTRRSRINKKKTYRKTNKRM
jgi:hypothetical protein